MAAFLELYGISLVTFLAIDAVWLGWLARVGYLAAGWLGVS